MIAGLTAPQSADAEPSLKDTEDYIEHVLDRYAARPAKSVDSVAGSVNKSGTVYFSEKLNDRGRRYSYDLKLTDIGWIQARNTNKARYSRSGGRCDAVRADLICRTDDCVESVYHPGRSKSGILGRVTEDNVKTYNGLSLYFCKSDWQELERMSRAWDHASRLRNASGTKFVNEVRDMDDIGSAFD